MGLHEAKDIESRFTRYVEELVSVIGHADRAGPFRDYCTGLVMPGERKSVEPMAAITAPGRTAAQHQSLLHFVGQGAWSDDAVLTKVRQTVLPRMTPDGPIEAWIIDDTAFRKGAALGGCVTPVLRAAWQAGELPGRGDTVDCQSPCEPSGGISVVFAERLGRGR
jgi:SRSO17 transposase